MKSRQQMIHQTEEVVCQDRGLRSIDAASILRLACVSSDANAVKYLNLDRNEISNDGLAGVCNFPTLVSLSLRKNAIESLRPLSSLPTLCASLTKLDVSHNSLSSLAGIEKILNLQDINASHNLLEKVSELFDAQALRRLNLSYNSIESTEGIYDLPVLHSLDLSHNCIESDIELSPSKQCQDKLKSLCLEGNSFAQQCGWREMLCMAVFPKLVILDGDRIPVDYVPRKRFCSECTCPGGAQECERKKKADDLFYENLVRKDKARQQKVAEMQGEEEEEEEEEEEQPVLDVISPPTVRCFVKSEAAPAATKPRVHKSVATETNAKLNAMLSSSFDRSPALSSAWSGPQQQHGTRGEMIEMMGITEMTQSPLIMSHSAPTLQCSVVEVEFRSNGSMRLRKRRSKKKNKETSARSKPTVAGTISRGLPGQNSGKSRQTSFAWSQQQTQQGQQQGQRQGQQQQRRKKSKKKAPNHDLEQSLHHQQQHPHQQMRGGRLTFLQEAKKQQLALLQHVRQCRLEKEELLRTRKQRPLLASSQSAPVLRTRRERHKEMSLIASQLVLVPQTQTLDCSQPHFQQQQQPHLHRDQQKKHQVHHLRQKQKQFSGGGISSSTSTSTSRSNCSRLNRSGHGDRESQGICVELKRLSLSRNNGGGGGGGELFVPSITGPRDGTKHRTGGTGDPVPQGNWFSS